MRLAIADPPYPPNLLAAGRSTGHGPPLRASRWYGDLHPRAGEWDSVERHRELLAHLVRDYDGWALATTPDAVAAGVYAPLPYGTKVMAWVRPNAMPTAHRIGSYWEPVIVFTTRINRDPVTLSTKDVLTAPVPGGFPGAKPRAWTRWVLDALGYHPDEDTVDDLFAGSGAVAAEIAQGVLL